MTEALSTNRYLLNSNEPKDQLLIPHKLPMLAHSFDSPIQSKQISKFTLTQNDSKAERIQSLNSSSMKARKQKNNKTSIINNSRGGGSIDNKSKAISHRNNNNNNKTSKYTIEDYERDLRYLYKRGYRHTSLAKIKPGLMKI